MKKALIVIFLFWLCGIDTTATAQRVGLSTNLPGWATASPNIGLEIGLGNKSSLEVYGSINPFRFDEGRQWRHWLLQPEYRFWPCERFYKHFWGIHLIGGEYNIAKVTMPFGAYKGLRDTRYQGWGVGAGISYGYQWLLSRHWSMEATVGVGYVYSQYDRYPCAKCGRKIESGRKHYVGPTKAAISLICLF